MFRAPRRRPRPWVPCHRRRWMLPPARHVRLRASCRRDRPVVRPSSRCPMFRAPRRRPRPWAPCHRRRSTSSSSPHARFRAPCLPTRPVRPRFPRRHPRRRVNFRGYDSGRLRGVPGGNHVLPSAICPRRPVRTCFQARAPGVRPALHRHRAAPPAHLDAAARGHDQGGLHRVANRLHGGVARRRPPGRVPKDRAAGDCRHRVRAAVAARPVLAPARPFRRTICSRA